MNKMLDASNVQNFTKSLMSVDSTTGQEGELGKLLGKYLESEGYHVTYQPLTADSSRANILATTIPHIPGQTKGPKLIFNTHFDTVPPYIPPSFSPDGAVLKGRGSCDAKGVLAAMVFAARELLNEDRSMDLGLLFVVGEETDHCGAIEANKLQLQPQAVICGEPTELKLATGQKGGMKFKLFAHGKAAHSGYPERGISAIEPLLDALQEIRVQKWPRDPELGDTTANIGLIQGGAAPNIVPAYAEATLAIRLVTEPEVIVNRIKSLLKDPVQLEVQGMNGPLKLHTVAGFETESMAFNTDLPYFRFSHHPKLCLMGPGSITVAHGAQEFISVKDLQTGVSHYKRLAKLLLAGN